MTYRNLSILTIIMSITNEWNTKNRRIFSPVLYFFNFPHEALKKDIPFKIEISKDFRSNITYMNHENLAVTKNPRFAPI
eukprot:UN25388